MLEGRGIKIDKKILQINVTLNSGSTGRIAENLGLLVIEGGGVSYIAYGRKRTKSSSLPVKIGSFLSVGIHGLLTRFCDMHGLGSRIATIRLVKEIKRINPDLIHLHNIHGYYINIKVLFRFLKQYDRPVLWTLHDCWSFTGHCTYFSHIDCLKWQTGCYKCPLIRDYPASLGFDRSIKNFKLKKQLTLSLNKLTIVTVSDWLRSLTEKSFLNHLDRFVIHNGVDLDIFRPYEIDVKKKYGITTDKYILGVANKWSKRKGLHDILELRKILDPDIKIVLVGGRLSPNINIPGKIKCFNKTEDIQMLAELYSGAEVFINPSSMESFGLTTVEAMACGTPVIVYNSTASPEIVNPSVGIVVEKHDIKGFHAAIMRVLSDGKQKYTKECRSFVEQYFDKNKQNIKYINLYKRILGID